MVWLDWLCNFQGAQLGYYFRYEGKKTNRTSNTRALYMNRMYVWKRHTRSPGDDNWNHSSVPLHPVVAVNLGQNYAQNGVCRRLRCCSWWWQYVFEVWFQDPGNKDEIHRANPRSTCHSGKPVSLFSRSSLLLTHITLDTISILSSH